MYHHHYVHLPLSVSYHRRVERSAPVLLLLTGELVYMVCRGRSLAVYVMCPEKGSLKKLHTLQAERQSMGMGFSASFAFWFIGNKGLCLLVSWSL